MRIVDVNVIERAQLIENLMEMRQQVCAYGGGEMCDCKYANVGLNGTPIRTCSHDENGNGCPELLNAVMLLQRLTDEEYAEILGRQARLGAHPVKGNDGKWRLI